MLVGRVTVDDYMDLLRLGNLGVDIVEKSDELLMPRITFRTAHLSCHPIFE
jgi:hypothetical protein